MPNTPTRPRPPLAQLFAVPTEHNSSLIEAEIYSPETRPRCASAEMPSLLRRGVVWLLAYDGFLFHHLAQLFLGGGSMPCSRSSSAIRGLRMPVAMPPTAMTRVSSVSTTARSPR